MCIRDRYLEVEGFDEISFPVAFNDVDFCLKLKSKGYQNVFTPDVQALHHEGFSRGEYELTDKRRSEAEKEALALHNKWKQQISNDFAFHPALARDKEDCAFYGF